MPPSRPRDSTDSRPSRHRAGRLSSGAAIRGAAAGLFLERGYDGTSMDDIAAAASVSKQTIYTHFSDKESLFAALVMENADRVENFLGSMGAPIQAAAGVEAGLRDLADMYLRFVIRPDVLRLRRLILSQAGRFPDVARSYYDRVPRRMYSSLEAVIGSLAQRGDLEVADVRTAAEQFAWLVLGPALDAGMFVDPPPVPGETRRRQMAEAAVRTFLAAYAPSASAVRPAPSRPRRARRA